MTSWRRLTADWTGTTTTSLDGPGPAASWPDPDEDGEPGRALTLTLNKFKTANLYGHQQISKIKSKIKSNNQIKNQLQSNIGKSANSNYQWLVWPDPDPWRRPALTWTPAPAWRKTWPDLTWTRPVPDDDVWRPGAWPGKYSKNDKQSQQRPWWRRPDERLMTTTLNGCCCCR